MYRSQDRPRVDIEVGSALLSIPNHETLMHIVSPSEDVASDGRIREQL